MKVLFAVSQESVSELIMKKYQQMYKEIITGKNVYYFNAIIKELQKDKSYDRIVISEDLEPFTSNNYETVDKFIFEKLDKISDEATNPQGDDIPIILIATDRREKSDNLLVKLFGISIYSALLGKDRSIDEVCKLIQKPRSKKEAKSYYKISSNDVEYRPESEEDVSEAEIQSILSYFKRLGRNEERYVETFNSVASQYTDQQLKLIIKFLPLNVKAVLEENCPKYQQLVSYIPQNKNTGLNNYQSPNKTKMKNNTSKAIENSGIRISSISSSEKKLTKPVIIPSASRKKKVQETKKENPVKQNTEVAIAEKIKPEKFKEEPMEEPLKRRGRPKKNVEEVEEKIENDIPKRRGRPKKNKDEEVQTSKVEEQDNTLPIFEEEMELPGFDEYNEEEFPGSEEQPEYEEEEAELPGFEEQPEYEEEEAELPGFEEQPEYEEEEAELPGFEEQPEYEEEEAELPRFEEEPEYEEKETELPRFEEDTEIEQEDFNENISSQTFDENNYQKNNNYNSYQDSNQLQDYNKETSSIEGLLTNNQKVVAFVGTSKNGTSFLVNNLAEIISSKGIKTAILDLTKNKNSYYIYTKNEEELRKIATQSVEKLTQGIAQGIKVNNNLDVYTTLPGEDQAQEDYKNILETLVNNYSLILLDCDFKTNYAYLNNAQEIYLVQSMDVLTIQPLTAYLRDLKAKEVLKQNKLKIVINKYIKVNGISEKAIIGGMAFYNDPAMAYMTELFNRETIPYCTIPFDNQVYSKYLEALINCKISTNGYSKDFMNSMQKLANTIYPLIGTGKQNSNKEKYNNPKYNKFANSNKFSNDMNSTLDKMRGKF